MLPDRVSNPGPLTYESGALPIALRGPAGGDIRSVPYIRAYVCSPFVIALGTSFIIRFQYKFTQVLCMTMPRTSSRFCVIGTRSSSQ